MLQRRLLAWSESLGDIHAGIVGFGVGSLGFRVMGHISFDPCQQLVFGQGSGHTEKNGHTLVPGPGRTSDRVHHQHGTYLWEALEVGVASPKFEVMAAHELKQGSPANRFGPGNRYGYESKGKVSHAGSTPPNRPSP